MRPRLRFGLRTLLVALSLLGIGLGVAGRWWLENRRQEALVDQCEKKLASEGQVILSRDDQQNAYFVFYGQLSLASAQALCNADYVRWRHHQRPYGRRPAGRDGRCSARGLRAA